MFKLFFFCLFFITSIRIFVCFTFILATISLFTNNITLLCVNVCVSLFDSFHKNRGIPLNVDFAVKRTAVFIIVLCSFPGHVTVGAIFQ